MTRPPPSSPLFPYPPLSRPPPPRRTEQQESSLPPSDPRKSARLFERLSRRGDRLRRRERVGRPPAGDGLGVRRPPLPATGHGQRLGDAGIVRGDALRRLEMRRDRKSTRLNSSHLVISYAVFCLKKK